MAEFADTHLTKDEVAARLRVSRRTVETLMSTKQLGYVKVGRCVRIPSRAVAAFLEGATRSPEPQKPTRVHTARAAARKSIRH